MLLVTDRWSTKANVLLQKAYLRLLMFDQNDRLKSGEIEFPAGRFGELTAESSSQTMLKVE